MIIVDFQNFPFLLPYKVIGVILLVIRTWALEQISHFLECPHIVSLSIEQRLVILSNHKSSYHYAALHTTSSDLQIKILHPHTQPYILFHVLMADGDFFAVKCLRNSRT